MADGLDVIDGDRDAIAGSLAQSHCAIDDGVEDDVSTMEAHVLKDRVGRLETVGVHGHEDALDGEIRVHIGLHNTHCIKQFSESFECEILALHGDDNRVGSHQGVEGHQSERRRTVNEDEVVVVLDVGDSILHAVLAAVVGNHLDFGTDQMDSGGHEVKVRGFGFHHSLRSHLAVHDAIVNADGIVIGIDTHAAGSVTLRVGVNQQYTKIQQRQRRRQIHSGGGLPHPALLIYNGNNFPHYNERSISSNMFPRSMSSSDFSKRSFSKKVSSGTVPFSMKSITPANAFLNFSKSSL